uniref:Uncharacterized protein n=1 Tax=Anguilla anguilla TaxID=7936 RepID=A0A0E9VND6_ANGAN
MSSLLFFFAPSGHFSPRKQYPWILLRYERKCNTYACACFTTTLLYLEN